MRACDGKSQNIALGHDMATWVAELNLGKHLSSDINHLIHTQFLYKGYVFSLLILWLCRWVSDLMYFISSFIIDLHIAYSKRLRIQAHISSENERNEKIGWIKPKQSPFIHNVLSIIGFVKGEQDWEHCGEDVWTVDDHRNTNPLLLVKKGICGNKEKGKLVQSLFKVVQWKKKGSWKKASAIMKLRNLYRYIDFQRVQCQWSQCQRQC